MAKKKNFWEQVADVASRSFDQINPFDNGKNWNNRTGNAPAPRPAPLPPPMIRRPVNLGVPQAPTYLGAPAPAVQAIPRPPAPVAPAPSAPSPLQVGPIQDTRQVTIVTPKPRGQAATTPKDDSFMGGLKQFGKEIVQPHVNRADRWHDALSPQVAKNRENDLQLMEQQTANIAKAAQKIRDPATSPQEKIRWQRFLDRERERAAKDFEARTKELDRIVDLNDPKKALADEVIVNTDVASLGLGGLTRRALIKGGEKAFGEVAKTMAKNTSDDVVREAGRKASRQAQLQTMKKPIAINAGLGATNVAAYPVSQRGDDATAGEIAASAAFGAAGGAIATPLLVGAADVASRGAGAVARSFANKNPIKQGILQLDDDIAKLETSIYNNQRAYAGAKGPKQKAAQEQKIAAQEDLLESLRSQRRNEMAKTYMPGNFLAGKKSRGWEEAVKNKETFEVYGGKMYEGSDEGLKIKAAINTRGDTVMKVGDIIDHPEMFEAYPFLKNLKLVYKAIPDEYNPRTGTRSISYGSYNGETKTMTLNSLKSVKEKVETLMHELSHAVDVYERMPMGGGAQFYLDDVVTKRLARQGGSPNSARRTSLRNKVDQYKRALDIGTENGQKMTKTRKDALKKILAKAQADLDKEMRKKTKDQLRFEAYEDLIGENKARTVENRLGMTKAQRKARPFTSDWDRNPKYGVERKDDGTYGSAMRNPAQEVDYSNLVTKPKKGAIPATNKQPVEHPAVKPGAPIEGGGKVPKTTAKKPKGIIREVEDAPLAKAPPKYEPVDLPDTKTTEYARHVYERDAYLLDLAKNMEKQTGQKGFYDDIYRATGEIARSNALGESMIRYSTDLIKAFKGLTSKEMNEFNLYSAARAELATRKMKGPKYKTSRPVEDLQRIYDQGHGKYKKRFAAMNAYYRGLAKQMKDNDLITDRTYRQFIESDDFIHIQRDVSDLMKFEGEGAKGASFNRTITSFKRKGSEREVLPADATVFRFTQQIAREIERNKAANLIIDALYDHKMAKQIKNTTNKNFISRRIHGRVEHYEVDKEIAEAVRRLEPYQIGFLGRIIGAPSRVFRATTTALASPFSFANYFMDQMGSAIFSKSAKDTHGNPMNAIRALRLATSDFVTNRETDPLWKKFIASAGDTTSYDLTRNVRNSKEMSRDLRMGVKGRGVNAILHPVRTLEDFNSITERATRFQNFKGIYNKTLKETGSKEEATKQATLAAWQNSVDFQRAGDVGRIMNLLIPYTNANIQGTRLMGRRLRQAPAGTLMKMTGLVTVPWVALSMWNNSDPQRKEIYGKLRDYEKDNNFIFIIPNTTPGTQNEDNSFTVLKMPAPPGIRDLMRPTRRAADSFFGKDPIAADKMLQDVLQAAAGPIQIGSFDKFLGGITPQAVKPTLQQAMNKDLYTGNEIVRKDMEEATDAEGNPIPEPEKYEDYTSGTARTIGKMTNTSPVRAEKFLRDTFGSVGRYGLNAADRVANAAGLIPEDQIGGISPFADVQRRFTRASAEEDMTPTDGSRYFQFSEEEVNKANGNAREAWKAIHPQRTNFRNDRLSEKSIVTPGVKAGTYLDNPETFEIDKRIDARLRKAGLPGDPLFDLPPNQRQTVLTLQAQRSFDPNNDMAVKAIYNANPWLEKFDEDRSAYFDKVKLRQDEARAIRKAEGKQSRFDLQEPIDPSGIPKPKVTPEIDRAFEVSKQITDPKLKAEFYKQNPKLTEYLAQNEQYNRAKRAWLGLPQFDKFPENPQAKALEEKYFTLDKAGRKAFLKANPSLTDYWLAKNLYSLNRAGALAQYEGENLDEDAVKDIQSIARSLGGGFGSGGGGGGGGGSSAEKPESFAAPRKPTSGGSPTVRRVAVKKRTAKKITVRRNKRV